MLPDETRGDGAVASIAWLSHDDGGRRALPTGPTYRCVVRFTDDHSRKSEAWDVEIRFIDPPAQTGGRATIAFLAQGAPTQYLVRAHRFALLEGPKVVARGEIVDVDDAAAVAEKRVLRA